MTTYKFGIGTFQEFISNPESQIGQEYLTDTGFYKTFHNIYFDEDILLFENEIYPKNIILSGCTFNSINIEGAEFEGHIQFRNCVFEKDFIIYDGKFKNIQFHNCEFKEELTIYNIITDIFTLDNCISKNPINITGGKILNFFYHSSSEKTHLRIEGKFTLIHFLSISTSIGATISASELIIRLLNIEGDYNSNSRINFKNIKIFDVALKSVNNDGKIYFTNFNTENITNLKLPELNYMLENVDDVSTKQNIEYILKNDSRVKTFLQIFNHIAIKQDVKNLLYVTFFREILIIQPINSKPNFIIEYSSMGHFELKRINLEKYTIFVKSTDLSSIKLINTFFPLTQKEWTHSDGLSVYMDLYSSANKQNNIADKIEYYRVSQKHLYKKLLSAKLSSQKLGSLSTIIVSDFYSNHGTNWIKAVLITVLLLGIPLFGLFIISFENIKFDFSIRGIKFYTEELLPYFPEFINPLHRIDFMDNNSLIRGSWAGAIDLISRILIGIGIFEMVRSFRKYVRT